MREFPSLVPFKAGPHALDPGGVERLALSESPFGASPNALAAARAEVERINHYPNSDTEPLRGAIADHYGVPADWVLVGNGADELILLTVLATCAAGGTGVTTERTFAGYTAAFETAGLKPRLVPLDESGPDLDALADQARTADITIVCNPHNPLGRALDSDEIRRLHQATVEGNGVLVLDEAYGELASPEATDRGPRMLPVIHVKARLSLFTPGSDRGPTVEGPYGAMPVGADPRQETTYDSKGDHLRWQRRAADP